MLILHARSITIPDGTNTDIVRPSDWLSAHNQLATLGGNTAGVSTLSGTNFILSGGNNVTLSGVQGANAGTIEISAGADTVDQISFSAGTQSAVLGSLIFSNSNNVSFGLDGSTVTATATVATSLTNIRLSAGTTSNLLSALTFSNANGISFGLDASTLTASHNALTSQSNQAFSAAGGSSAFQTLSFNNANGVSFSNAGGAVEASIATSLTNIRVSAGTTSNLLSALTFSNANNVSFGLDASTLTASIATSLTAIRLSAGTTSNLLSAVTFADGNGVSFGLDASTVTASLIGLSAGVSNLGNTAGNTTVNTGSRLVLVGNNQITLNQATAAGATTVSFNLPVSPFIAGASTAGNTAGDTGLTGTRLMLVGSNQLSLSQATDVNGATVSFFGPLSATTVSAVASANAIGTRDSRFALEDHQHAGVFSAGVSNVGNTAGNTRVDAGRFVLAGSNALTLSQETAANALNTVHIQGPLSATTVSAVGSTNVIGTRGSRFALEDHEHAGVFSAGVSTGGNTSGNTRVEPGRFVFAGGPNITLSQATAAGGLNTITISGATVAGQPVNFSAGTTSNDLGSVVFSNSNRVSFGLNGSTITAQHALNFSAGTTSQNISDQIVFSNSNGVSFGLNGSTITASIVNLPTVSGWIPFPDAALVVAAQSNQSLRLAPRILDCSASWDRMVMPLHFSQATNSTLTVSNTIYWGAYTRNGDSLSLVYSNSGSFSINGSGTASSSANSGIRIVSLGDTTGLSAGAYVLGYVWRSSTAGANASLSNLCMSQIASTFSGYIGSGSVTNRGLYNGLLGVWTSTTSGMPDSLALTDVRQNSSAFLRHPIVYFTSGSI